MGTSRFLAGVAVVAFLVSLILPSVNGMWGILTLVFGASSLVFDPPWFLVWVANPIIIVAFVMRMNGKAPVAQRLLPLLAVICAVYALLAQSIAISDAGAPKPVEIQFGYWLWLGAMAVFAVASLIAVGPPIEPETEVSTSTTAPSV